MSSSKNVLSQLWKNINVHGTEFPAGLVQKTQPKKPNPKNPQKTHCKKTQPKVGFLFFFGVF